MATEVRRRARELDARGLNALSWSQLLATLHEALDLVLLAFELRRRYVVQGAASQVRLWLLLRLVGRQRLFGTMQSGVETVTLEINRALAALASQVRSDETLRNLFAATASEDLLAALQHSTAGSARTFLASFNQFLERYRNRETTITLASLPAWKNAPHIPLGLLKSMAASEPRAVRNGTPAWMGARDELLQQTVLGKPPLRALFLRWLERARLFPSWREDTHFYMTLALPTTHRCFLELGRRLVAAGVSPDASDVLHLKLSELEAAHWHPSPEVVEQWRLLIAQRKAKRESVTEQPVIDPRYFVSTAVAGDAIVTGTPGSPGVAAGHGRIINSPAEFSKLQAGDILVAPYTNPAWTALFQRAAAVVVDTGGAGSHAAVVARENSVPAVMGTRDGTRRLHDGQHARVDGSAGRVFSIDE